MCRSNQDDEDVILIHGVEKSSNAVHSVYQTAAKLRHWDELVVEVIDALVLHSDDDSTPTRDAYHSVHVFGLLFRYLVSTQPATTEFHYYWNTSMAGSDPDDPTVEPAKLAHIHVGTPPLLMHLYFLS